MTSSEVDVGPSGGVEDEFGILLRSCARKRAVGIAVEEETLEGCGLCSPTLRSSSMLDPMVCCSWHWFLAPSSRMLMLSLEGVEQPPTMPAQEARVIS